MCNSLSTFAGSATVAVSIEPAINENIKPKITNPCILVPGILLKNQHNSVPQVNQTFQYRKTTFFIPPFAVLFGAHFIFGTILFKC